MKLRISGKSGDCEISSGELEDLAGMVKPGRTLIVTDSNVSGIYGKRFPDAEVVEVRPGEENKTLDTVRTIYDRMLEVELDRSSLVVGIGGGLVCDVAGYAAATYHRGMDLGFVPTTLLAQVDAAIGGKNGVNYNGYKNIIGTIRQPRFVLCDVGLLKTLSEEEMRNGYAEVVKHAAIEDAKAFDHLERNADALAACAADAAGADERVMAHVVQDSVAVKARIVQADENESGERMKLNFGHTIGHAIELQGGLRHGEAVSIGMVAEARISVEKGLMAKKDAMRLEGLLVSLGLPVKLQSGREALLDGIRKDKKRREGNIRMPVLDGIGRARIADVRISDLEGAIDDMY